MILDVIYFTIENYKRTSISLGDNYYMIKGFVGEDEEDELFELVDAILNFKIANEEEIVIGEEEFNEIHKDIIQEFEIEVEPWRCGEV